MDKIKAALDAAFAAYLKAVSDGIPEEIARDVGIARYRAFFPQIDASAFEALINDARSQEKAGGEARGLSKEAVLAAQERGPGLS